MNDQSKGPTPEHVEVAVVTTSGRYPTTGFNKVAAHQPVQNELNKAAKELHIVDTTGWVARVNGREIDPAKNYIDNQLTASATLTIDYGPREGGGGNE
jgi:hypothetical protein